MISMPLLVEMVKTPETYVSWVLIISRWRGMILGVLLTNDNTFICCSFDHFFRKILKFLSNINFNF